MKNGRIGSSFKDFLREQGIEEEVEALAQKRVIAWQIEQAMIAAGVTKVEMARRMGTSRTQIDRLLDPENARVQLDTLQRAAMAVGRRLKVELVPVEPIERLRGRYPRLPRPTREPDRL